MPSGKDVEEGWRAKRRIPAPDAQQQAHKVRSARSLESLSRAEQVSLRKNTIRISQTDDSQLVAASV